MTDRPSVEPLDLAALWRESGAAVAHRPGRGLCRSTSCARVTEVVGRLDRRGAGIAALVGAAGVGVLGERAAVLGLGRGGIVSCGGATHLVRERRRLDRRLARQDRRHRLDPGLARRRAGRCGRGRSVVDRARGRRPAGRAAARRARARCSGSRAAGSARSTIRGWCWPSAAPVGPRRADVVVRAGGGQPRFAVGRPARRRRARPARRPRDHGGELDRARTAPAPTPAFFEALHGRCVVGGAPARTPRRAAVSCGRCSSESTS